jgi:hypothetical protein
LRSRELVATIGLGASRVIACVDHIHINPSAVLDIREAATLLTGIEFDVVWHDKACTAALSELPAHASRRLQFDPEVDGAVGSCRLWDVDACVVGPASCCLGELAGSVQGSVPGEDGDHVAELRSGELVAFRPVLPPVECIAEVFGTVGFSVEVVEVVEQFTGAVDAVVMIDDVA